MRDAFTRENLERTCSYLILAGLRQNRETELHLYFPRISLQPELERMYFYPPLVPELLEYWSEADYDQRFGDYANALMHCRLLADAVVQELRRIEKDSARRKQYDRLVRIFALTDAEHFYVIYMKILSAEKNGDRGTLREHFRYLFAHVVDIFQLPDYIWEIAMESPDMIHALFLEIPFEQWKSGIDAYIERADAQSVERRMEMLRMRQFLPDIRYGYFFVRAREALLVYGRHHGDDVKQRELLRAFSESALTFYRLFFTERAFQGEMEFLPGSCRAAVHIREALGCEDEAVDQALVWYGRAIKAFPSFENVLRGYCEGLKKSTGEERAEMAELALGVKNQIRILLEHGLAAEAAEALRQLKTLVPEDGELWELESIACELAEENIYH